MRRFHKNDIPPSIAPRMNVTIRKWWVIREVLPDRLEKCRRWVEWEVLRISLQSKTLRWWVQMTMITPRVSALIPYIHPSWRVSSSARSTDTGTCAATWEDCFISREGDSWSYRWTLRYRKIKRWIIDLRWKDRDAWKCKAIHWTLWVA